MRIAPIVGFTASLLAAMVSSAVGQEPAAPPAHISFVEGTATLERHGELEAAALNMPVIEGDRLRTTTGRLQLAFPDGSAVDLEPDSEIEYLGAARVRVYTGTIEHRPAVAPRSASALYLPADSQSYAGDLDQNGTWQYDSTYGNVWYPTVAADWRPYYYGYWSSVPTYGWTWIGYNRWAWPTHHYGRWGYASNRWYWIPGRAYSSAWVSWGTAPGYVSWCPLGFDSRPVVGLSIGYSRGWNAWTIVPRDHFGWRGYPAHRYAVEPSRIAATTPFIVHGTQPPLSIRGAGPSTTAQRPGASVAALNAGYRAGTAVPRYSNPAYSRSESVNRGPAAGSFTKPLEREAFRTPAPPSIDRRPMERGSVSRPMEREGFSRAPVPSYPSSRPANQPPRPSHQPPPAGGSSRQGGGGGGGHAGTPPHADRGSSGASRGGSSAGSHGGGSHGTAVGRSR